jgi:plastocyanin
MKASLTMSVAALSLVTLVAGCGGSGKPASSGASAHASASATGPVVAEMNPADSGEVTMTITKLGFGAPISANPGEPIKVVNKDSVPHTVTSGTAFNLEVKSGATASFTAPTVPGNYPLTCHFTPKMHGTLTVRGI